MLIKTHLLTGYAKNTDTALKYMERDQNTVAMSPKGGGDERV